jgi:hypothetical protein
MGNIKKMWLLIIDFLETWWKCVLGCLELKKKIFEKSQPLSSTFSERSYGWRQVKFDKNLNFFKYFTNFFFFCCMKWIKIIQNKIFRWKTKFLGSLMMQVCFFQFFQCTQNIFCWKFNYKCIISGFRQQY